MYSSRKESMPSSNNIKKSPGFDAETKAFHPTIWPIKKIVLIARAAESASFFYFIDGCSS
jgi:hypothetical protein